MNSVRIFAPLNSPQIFRDNFLELKILSLAMEW